MLVNCVGTLDDMDMMTRLQSWSKWLPSRLSVTAATEAIYSMDVRIASSHSHCNGIVDAVKGIEGRARNTSIVSTRPDGPTVSLIPLG